MGKETPAVLAESLFVDGYPAAPGTFKYWKVKPESEKPDGLNFVCPCGCESVLGIQFTSDRGGPCWTWNGSREKPTCTPSILHLNGCKWHGYLTDGVFKEC